MHLQSYHRGNLPSIALDRGGHIEMYVNNENKGYFDGSGKLFNGLFLYNDWILWKNGMSIFIRDNF